MKVTTYLIFLSSFAILGHAHLTCQDCGDSPCKDVNDNGEVKECDEGALGCLYSEKHEQEGDIFIIERRCSMELDVSCEFDDHEGTPGDYDHFCICNTPNCNIDRECFKTCQNGTSTTPKSTTSQDHVHLTCQDCGDSPCKDINDNGEVKVCDEGALGCLYSEHHEQEGDITTIERRCSMELEIECVFDDNEGKPGDYDHYCICDTPNCNKDRECFKTCKNGTTSTITPSTTSKNHARLTCQDCGDVNNCKDINDNGEVKECDEGTVGCFYSEHYEQAVDVMRIERRCAKEIEIACVFDDHEGTPGDYDYYCICDTPNCNKDRECFKTCKNGTTTVTQSSTSQTTPTTTSSQTCLKSVPTILILLASISILKLL